MATPKPIKLKVKRDFYDKTEGLKKKKAGEELSVSPDRAEKLISLGLAERPTPAHPKRLLKSSRSFYAYKRETPEQLCLKKQGRHPEN